MFELSLRLLGPWPPGAYYTGAYIERDELLGHFHIRGYEGWFKTAEYQTFIKISSLGLRDRHETYAKPPGTYRILLLGDSFLEGIQVPARDSVAERLETLLNERSSKPIDLVNAGVAAYGTAQELLLYENDTYRYQPDLVLLFFFVGNDVKNNSYILEIPGGKKELALKPYYDLDKDGDLTLLPGPPPLPVHPLIGAMRQCCWAYNMLEGNVFVKLGPAFVREDLEVAGGARDPVYEIYDADPSSPWRHAWRITEALLAKLERDTRAHGAPLVLVGIPERRALADDLWNQAMADRRSKDARSNRDAPTDRLSEVAGRLGIPYIDLLSVFRREAEQGHGPFYYASDPHWNRDGHATAARAIDEALRALGVGQ